MKIESGSLLDVTDGIICHQVNCQRVAGKGLALAIRKKYPGWYKEYISREHIILNHAGESFGECWIYKVNSKLSIASFYSQFYYGNKERYTNYEMFVRCLERLADQMKDLQVYFPKGIGCNNAGGNWNIIKTMIEEYIPNAIIREYR